MRAMEPTSQGFVQRDGVRVGFEVFGAGEPTILLLSAWAIVHARQWKAQIPYLARYCRVVVVEARGNGRSDRPSETSAYTDREYVADGLAALDATHTDRAVVVGWSLGARCALLLAAWHPERVLGVVAIAPALPNEPDAEDDGSFDAVREAYEGWERFNRHAWLQDYQGFSEFFMRNVFSDAHSTKQVEDGIEWSQETTPETLISIVDGVALGRGDELEAIRSAVGCPVLTVHGTDDQIIPLEDGERVAEWTGGSLVTISGGGHGPPMRDPVRVNLLIRDFVEALGSWRPRRTEWTAGRDRRRRALFVSSPIGLGHARRDLAIADELRVRHPDLQVEWLAQHPVTEVLAARDEIIHPASRWLASESGHLESECGEHDLHVFSAFRRMDEILVANFMVFHDVVTEETFDLVVADEAWDVDHFLHENPELKRSPLVWLTDFVGWLPMPVEGPQEAALTADYNAEMVEHVARYPRLRDRSIFVGNPDDLVTDPLGPGLPSVAEWTTRHYDFAGYVTGFDPGAVADVASIRAELGWRPDEQVCLVTVGGSGVGTHLLKRVTESFELARERVPGLRMVAVAGPRIDPGSLRLPSGVEVHGYLPGLFRHLAACDLAVVQGGLTTTMELVATRRPFLYVPLARHFEQQIHVPHRLSRYGAGRRLEYRDADPERLADVIAEEIFRDVDYRKVETDGAARAAAMIGELL